MLVSRKCRLTWIPPTNLKVCAAPVIRDTARRHLKRRMEERLRLVELDFQPPQEPARRRMNGMDMMCRG